MHADSTLQNQDLTMQKAEAEGADPASGAPRQLLVKPNFIIIGAMKSGTTSLHTLLDSHPRVYMPDGEVQLFSIDDVEQNPVFITQVGGQWTYQHFDRFFDEYATWHQTLYAGASPGQVLGEDAPSYLPSEQAIARIAQYLPDAKLLVVLRDPVERLYSQYWHWVRSYRAIYSLEDTIRYQPGSLLQRSYYEKQLRYCFSMVPREQVHVVLLEEFIRDQKNVAEGIFRFLDLEMHVETSERKRHVNKGNYPRYHRLALWRNRTFRHLYGRRYHGSIPRMPESEPLTLRQRMGIKALRWINPQTSRCPTDTPDDTHAFLSRYLYECNAGLPELLGRDLGEYWPTFRKQWT